MAAELDAEMWARAHADGGAGTAVDEHDGATLPAELLELLACAVRGYAAAAGPEAKPAGRGGPARLEARRPRGDGRGYAGVQ